MNKPGSFYTILLINNNIPYSSSEVALSGSGNNYFSAYNYSYLSPNNKRAVASPPSSTMVHGPLPSGHTNADIVFSQYSSYVIPLCAKTTEVPFLTTAAAASS